MVILICSSMGATNLNRLNFNITDFRSFTIGSFSYFPEVKDVVHPILYLLSDKADMINGVTLPIDGGYLAC